MGVNGVSATNARNNVAAPGSVTPDGANADPATSGPLLPQPRSVGWDIGSQVAILLLESSKKARETAQKEEDFDFEAEKQADQRQIDAMHDEASTMRTAACTSGLLDIGSGALQFVGADLSSDAKVASTGAEAATKAGDVGAMELAQKACALSTAGAAFAGGAKTLDAANHTSAGIFSANELDARTRQKQDEQDARVAKKAGDDAHDAVREADDQAKKTLDFLREFESQQHSAALASANGVRA